MLTQESQSSEKKVIICQQDDKFVVSKLGSAAIKGSLDLETAHMLYTDLKQAQTHLVLVDALHLLYLVTPYEFGERFEPDMQLYYNIFTKLSDKELKTAKLLGLNEACALSMLAGKPIKTVEKRVLNRFYSTLMLNELWYETPVFQVSEKYQVNRGFVQNLMSNAASFASSVVYFCQELSEFWPFVHLLKGMCDRLNNCCVKELLPLMDLPAVKQNRAKQLYKAGYKTLQSIGKANPEELMQNIEFLSRKVANQLIVSSKMLLLQKMENLREEAEDMLDGMTEQNNFFDLSYK